MLISTSAFSGGLKDSYLFTLLDEGEKEIEGNGQFIR